MTSVTSVRALSPTRLRVDFSGAVKVNNALRRVENYTIQTDVTSARPVVLSVNVPGESPTVNYVELITSEMTSLASYAFVANCSLILDGQSANAITDGNMEAVGTAAWTAAGGAVLSKENFPEEPGGSGPTKVLRATGTPFCGASQNYSIPGGVVYALAGWARTDGNFGERHVQIGGPFINNAGHLRQTTNNSVWFKFGPYYTKSTGGSDSISLSLTGGTLFTPWAEFENVTLTAVGAFNGSPDPIVDASDVAVMSNTLVFIGEGSLPKIALAIARSPTTMEVIFDEPIQDAGSIRKVESYTANLSLTFVEVLEVDIDRVLLKTSPQTPGVLYTITLTGLFYDNGNNLMLSPSNSPMLGFIAPPAIEALLTLKMYNFLIDALRNEDQINGAQFIERYLKGPQEIWSAQIKSIFDIPKLWSASDVPDGLLQFLKRIVGWTKDLDPITNSLDLVTLRRLIAASVPFWKERGPEGAIEDLIRLATGARVYVLNWFDLRMILDEFQIGEDWEGTDPWILGTPGEGQGDESTYDIRVVDNGTLDRVLVRNLARLTRPVNERFQINYLGFFDKFSVDDDTSLWTIDDNGGSVTVDSGAMTLVGNGCQVFAGVVEALDWKSYVATWKVKLSDEGFGRLQFYRTSNFDQYYVDFATNTMGGSSNTITLFKLVGGVPTQLATVNLFSVFGERIYVNVYSTFRVEVSPEPPGSSTNRINVFFESEKVLTATDSAHAEGSVGAQRLSSGNVVLDFVEMFFVPAEYDFIDINS